jgi:GNAT superfamily N-acetyltransferase
VLIRQCRPDEVPGMLAVINDSAQAYRGIIPADCWKEPYMPEAELRGEISGGVAFWCAEAEGKITGVMGIQHVEDVSLIRHSYVGTADRGKGIGTALLEHLMKETDRPVLMGTWESAGWAIRFYERNGFTLLNRGDGWMLLRRYWNIPARQAETSVVLGDEKWCRERGCERT